jgi:hypothetical protein
MQILTAVLSIGLVFFIINGATKNTRYKTRGMVFLSLGFLISGVFIFAFFRDYKGGNWFSYYKYYLFILMPLIYGISFAYYYCIHMRGRQIIKKRNLNKYYFTDYLYIIYRYGNDICLEKKKDKYQGLVYRLKSGDFHDSFIHNLNRRLKITVRYDINKIGKVTYKSKRRTLYCYEIKLLEKQDISRLECINAYQLVNMPMAEFDKEILYRLVLGEPFDLDK